MDHISPAEKAIIGAILLDKEAYYKISHTFKVEYFESLEIRDIYMAIESLYRDRKAVDGVSISEVMGKTPEHKQEVKTTCTMLSFECPSSANIVQYADNVKAEYTRKKLDVVASTIRKDLIDKKKNPFEIEVEVLNQLQGMMQEDIPNKSVGFKESVSNWYTNYCDIVDEEKSGHTRTLYGINALDELTHGLKAGQVHVIAARTSVGKTTLAINLLYYIGQQKKRLLFFSMEMLEEQIMNRLLSRITGILYWKFEKNKLSDDELAQVKTTAEMLSKNFEIDFYYKGDLTAADIEMELMKHRANQYDVVILDYIQLLNSKKQNRYEVVTESSNKVKALAMNYRVPIIILAQLSRAAIGKEDEEPRLEHLKESGALEQDAEVVILMWRPSNEDDCKHGRKVYLIIAKNRNGPNNVTLDLPADYSKMFIGPTTLFEGMLT